MKRHRIFLFIIVGLIILQSLMIGAVNILVDPYNVVGIPVLSWVNALKPQSDKNARLFKSINVIRLKPKTIVLGNSRADIGIDPDHPALASAAPGYNLSIPSGDMYEAMRYFQHAIANQPDLKQVIIGIDLVAFEQKDSFGKLETQQKELLEKTDYKPQLLSLLLSTDTLSSSASTLVSNLKGEAVRENYLNNGRLVRTNPPSMPMKQVFKTHLQVAYFKSWYNNYRLSQQQLDAFRTIVETCKQKGITLKVFISPAHATQWEAVRVKDLWSVFETWKREVVKITPVWDFSGYNSITTEPLNDNMKNYLESSHYFKEIGDLVLNRMFDYQAEKVPADFGILVTSDNVESHLATLRSQRELWAAKNSDVVQLVQDWSREP
jgi:hypothetical protein